MSKKEKKKLLMLVENYSTISYSVKQLCDGTVDGFIPDFLTDDNELFYNCGCVVPIDEYDNVYDEVVRQCYNFCDFFFTTKVSLGDGEFKPTYHALNQQGMGILNKIKQQINYN